MRRRFLCSFAISVFTALAAAFSAFAAEEGFETAVSDTASPSQAPSPVYQQGTLEGLTFSNPWADYRITFPEGTYFNPDSLVEYMSAYTGLDYEFAANLYGDLTAYPSMNITFQDALIPLKECTQNLLDIYSEKDYSCQIKTGVWVGSHPFTRVRAETEASDVYIDNYLRIEDGKLIWICIKCQKDDETAQETVRQLLNSITAYDQAGSLN